MSNLHSIEGVIIAKTLNFIDHNPVHFPANRLV